jgi:acyl transferase domain-containing protein
MMRTLGTFPFKSQSSWSSLLLAILRAHLKNITDAEAETIPSCSSPDDYNTFMKAVAALYKNGVEFNFQKLVPKNRKHTDIPRYKFYRSGTLLTSDTVRATLQVNTPGGEQHPFVSQKPLSGQYNLKLNCLIFT